MKLIRNLYLSLLGFLALTGNVEAIIDTNSNGVSDVWERAVNQGNLFTSFDPQADTDADGWTNEQEALAGTSPFDSTPPQGIVRTTISQHPQQPGVFTIKWKPIDGKTSNLYVSQDLQTWTLLDSFPSTGQEIEIATDVTREDGTRPDHLFWRVQLTDSESETSSGFTAYEEEALSIAPGFTDNNNNEIPDDFEASHAGTFYIYPPMIGAKLFHRNTENRSIFVTNDTNKPVSFTSILSGNSFPGYSITSHTPHVWEEIKTTGTRLDSISNADDAYEEVPITGFTFPFYGQNYSNVYVSTNGLLTFSYGSEEYYSIALPHSAAPPNLLAPLWRDLSTSASGDIYYEQKADRLIIQYEEVGSYYSSSTYTFQVILFSDGTVDYRYKSLPIDSHGIIGLQNGNGSLGESIPLEDISAGSTLRIRDRNQILDITPSYGSVPTNSSVRLDARLNSIKMDPSVYYANFTLMHDGVGVSPAQVLTRLEIANEAPTIEFHYPRHLNVVGNSPTLTVYAKDSGGIQKVEFYQGSILLGTAGYDATGGYYRMIWHSLTTGAYEITAKVTDTHGMTALTQPILIFIGLDDTDEDGMTDTYEVHYGLDPNIDDRNEDFDNDEIPNYGEFLFGTNPTVPDSENFPWQEDPDSDGLTNSQELLTYHTNPTQPDTDNDGMDDGWEVKYGWDASVNNDTDLNPLNDYDADFESDGLTNAQESSMRTNPDSNDSDGDGIGDSSETNQGSDPNNPSSNQPPTKGTTKVEIVFGDHSISHSEKYRLRLDPLEGGTQAFQRINRKYGQTQTEIFELPKGAKYKITIHHVATDPNYEDNPSPDYDYTLTFTGVDSSDILIPEDPNGILGVHDESSPFFASGKEAKLNIMSFEIEAVAAIPALRNRQKIGVCENMKIKVTPILTSVLNWSITNPVNATVTPANGYEVIYGAEYQASTSTLKATFSNGTAKEIYWQIVEPSSERAEKNRDANEIFSPGQQGVRMILDYTTLPEDVSFERVEVLEVDRGTININGYFVGKDNLTHIPNPNWIRLDADNSWQDEAGFLNWSAPWSAGTYGWKIDVKWRPTNNAGVGQGTGTVFTTRNQLHRINGTDGTSIETKSEIISSPRTP